MTALVSSEDTVAVELFTDVTAELRLVVAPEGEELPSEEELAAAEAAAEAEGAAEPEEVLEPEEPEELEEPESPEPETAVDEAAHRVEVGNQRRKLAFG